MEFAEQAKKDAERIAALEAETKKQKADMRHAKIASFVEGLKKEGKYLPAWDRLGMVAFMESLDETPIEFSEGKKQSPMEFMQGFLAALPKIVDFKELAAGDEPPTADKREALIKDFAEKNKVNYKKAAIAIARLHPQLFE